MLHPFPGVAGSAAQHQGKSQLPADMTLFALTGGKSPRKAADAEHRDSPKHLRGIIHPSEHRSVIINSGQYHFISDQFLFAVFPDTCFHITFKKQIFTANCSGKSEPYHIDRLLCSYYKQIL